MCVLFKSHFLVGSMITGQTRHRRFRVCFPAVLGRGWGTMTTPNFTADPDPETWAESNQGLFRLLFPLPHLMSCVTIFNTALLVTPCKEEVRTPIVNACRC